MNRATNNNEPTLARMLRYTQHLAALPTFMQAAIEQLVEENKAWLEDKNREYMAREGQTVTGESIEPGGYSEQYKTYKKRYGRFKNTAFVDLKLMGDFHKSIVLTYQGNLVWNMESNDVKAKDLQRRYGQILGIRPEDATLFVQEILLPALRVRIQQYLTV